MNKLKFAMEALSRVGRSVPQHTGLTPYARTSLEHLRAKGFVTLNHLIDDPIFTDVRTALQEKIEKKFELNFPCLAQTKIEPERDSDLIDRNFLAETSELIARNLTFSRNDFSAYDDLLEKFKPSTLTVPMPSESLFYRLWLDPVITSIVSSYMGFVPHLTEAYVRRNFPSAFRIMNHNWHRDTNHDKHLLKVFIFFTDCDIETGAHHYIAGSVNDPRYRNKVYFTDEEVHSAWPVGSENHMVSTVPAGTIIIEDTRGLHKAGIPKRNFRDLGYAVFTPPNHFRRTRRLFKMSRHTYEELTLDQKAFIPYSNIQR